MNILEFRDKVSELIDTHEGVFPNWESKSKCISSIMELAIKYAGAFADRVTGAKP